MKTPEEITKELEAARRNVAALEKALEDAKAANNIKVGDYVICIDDGDSDCLLIENNIYKVEDKISNSVTTNTNVYLQGIRCGFLKDRFRKATREEVEKHLMKDAEARGFKVGAMVSRGQLNGAINELNVIINRNDINKSNDSSYVVDRWERYKSPFVAVKYNNFYYIDVIDNLVLVKDEIIVKTVDGAEYKADFSQVKDNKIVKFGCAEIDIFIFTDLNSTIRSLGWGNRAIESVQIGKGIFTPEIISKIVVEIEKNK